MTEPADLEKTKPIIVLESRRKALIEWLAKGQEAIKFNESEITRHKQEALEMLSEIDEIEEALKTLQAISTEKA